MLAVVTCHFNFAGYTRPRQNLWRFLRQIERDGIPVYGVEVYAESAPITRGTKNWIQIEANCNQIMWQKEAALNLAEKMVPESYSNIAWIDADVWFDRPDWANATEKSLRKNDVVQMFRNAQLTDRDGSIFMKRESVGLSCLTQKWDTHPGFAWAMRRELWRKGNGLYPLAITGGADTLMSLTFWGREPWEGVWILQGSNRLLYHQWAKNYEGVSVGAVPMDCYHEWHGEFKNRGYSERAKALSTLDSDKHLKIGENGLMEFTSEADPDLILAMHQYYFSRREDG